jgi:hypothetical protein
VTELSFIAMFLNNENIKKETRERERIYCKSMQMTGVCQAIFPRTWKIAFLQYAVRGKEESIKASSGRANGSKELIDNQLNDDEIVQADARNKNNDKVEELKYGKYCKHAEAP